MRQLWRQGGGAPCELPDRWHLGSDTKAFTATLAAERRYSEYDSLQALDAAGIACAQSHVATSAADAAAAAGLASAGALSPALSPAPQAASSIVASIMLLSVLSVWLTVLRRTSTARRVSDRTDY